MVKETTPLGGSLVKFRTAIALVVVLTALLAACGGDDDDSTTAAESTTPSTATPTLPPTTTTTSPPSPYKATVTPTTGLTEGATITVTVSDFKPGLTLGINVCANVEGKEFDETGKDCDLTNLKTLTVGPDGKGTGTSTVHVKPIGANNDDCSKVGTQCFVSVGELSADPNAQRADDINLTFAP